VSEDEMILTRSTVQCVRQPRHVLPWSVMRIATKI